MTQDERNELDIINRAEAEQSRERKAKGAKSAAPKQPKNTDNRPLTHNEVAFLYLWRAFEVWVETASREKIERMIKWLENPDTLEFAHEMISILMITEGIGTAHQIASEVEKKGGVQ